MPWVEGEPVIAPLEARARPGGHEPERTDQELPPLPPVAARVAAYAAPAIAAGRLDVEMAGAAAMIVMVKVLSRDWLVRLSLTCSAKV